MTKQLTIKDVRSAFTSAFSSLDERKQRIIIDRMAGRTLRQTADDLGLKSTGHIHQLENQAWNDFSRVLSAN